MSSLGREATVTVIDLGDLMDPIRRDATVGLATAAALIAAALAGNVNAAHMFIGAVALCVMAIATTGAVLAIRRRATATDLFDVTIGPAVAPGCIALLTSTMAAMGTVTGVGLIETTMYALGVLTVAGGAATTIAIARVELSDCREAKRKARLRQFVTVG